MSLKVSKQLSLRGFCFKYCWGSSVQIYTMPFLFTPRRVYGLQRWKTQNQVQVPKAQLSRHMMLLLMMLVMMKVNVVEGGCGIGITVGGYVAM